MDIDYSYIAFFGALVFIFYVVFIDCELHVPRRNIKKIISKRRIKSYKKEREG